MSAPPQVTIGTKHTYNTMKLTAAPTQGTIGATYTQNSIDTDDKNLQGGKW